MEYQIYKEAPKSVGKRLEELRKERGISQQELADKIGVKRAEIAQWEMGARTPDVDAWIILASFFGVSTDYIAGTSSHRYFKGASTSDKLDLDRLNEKGKHILFDTYHRLINDDETNNKRD